MIKKLFNKILEIFGSPDNISARESNKGPVRNTARTWRQAANSEHPGQIINHGLKNEISDPVDDRATHLLFQSCKENPLTNVLPSKIIRYIRAEALKGRRAEGISKDLQAMLPDMAKNQLESISRTVVRKTWTALDCARAEDLGVACIVDNRNDELFEKWLNLRDELKNNKRDKNWINVINNCNEIIQLDSEAKFIGIMIPIFYKEMASAYQHINHITNAIKFYSLAKEAFLKYRSEKPLNSPNDWLVDIERIDKKLSKLIQINSQKRA